MPRPGPRLHRLPQCNQLLIPAPLDLSITEVAGKSPLPTIIVTPCSPSSTHDFALAFIPSTQKPGIRERLKTYKTPYTSSWRIRTIICAFLLLFFVCQLLANRLAARYPRLDSTSAEVDVSSGGQVPPPQSSLLDWFNAWPKWGEEERVGERIPKVAPFDHEVGDWLD